MSDAIDVPGYLARLGLSGLAGHEPSISALRMLQQAHAERVPYECLEIHLGRSTTVSPAESVRRIVAGRGGYCFQLNGAFSALLRALGYRVTRHVGGVQRHDVPRPGIFGNHLVLTVSGLPSPDSPGGGWMVDLGMGDGPYGPLPLVAGEYRQGPFRYVLRPSEVAPGGWRFDHDPAGRFRGMDFRPGPAVMSDFVDKHDELSTSPDSNFVRVAVAARRDATGVDLLLNLSLARIGAEPAHTELTTAGSYFDVLADVFGMTFTAAERDILWPGVVAAHERRLGALDQKPAGGVTRPGCG